MRRPELGARELATALQDLGYDDFTVLAGSLDLSTVAERVAGFTSVAGRSRVEATAFSRDGGYRKMAELIAAGERSQCVFAVADIMAIGAMSAIRDAGLWPGEVSPWPVSTTSRCCAR